MYFQVPHSSMPAMLHCSFRRSDFSVRGFLYLVLRNCFILTLLPLPVLGASVPTGQHRSLRTFLYRFPYPHFPLFPYPPLSYPHPSIVRWLISRYVVVSQFAASLMIKKPFNYSSQSFKAERLDNASAWHQFAWGSRNTGTWSLAHYQFAQKCIAQTIIERKLSNDAIQGT